MTPFQHIKNWFRPEQKNIDDILRHLVSAYNTTSGVTVTSDNCERAPTVKAIVTAISRRVSILPIGVYRKAESGGRTSKEPLPRHPVAQLLRNPNEWMNPNNFWLDATSALVRYGNFYAVKSRGLTGPIRALVPVDPREVEIKVDANGMPIYRIHTADGLIEYPRNKIFHVRGPGRNFYQGASPIEDIREAIALEIAAEEFGATFFGNGAVPLMVFQYLANTAGFKSKEEEQAFTRQFQEAFGKKNRHKAMLLPKGVELGKPLDVANDKAQYLESRKLQRQVIAGAMGVPPHLVGSLEQSSYNNIEQQSLDFTLNCVLPYVRMFEAAMEADLLTPEDRSSGVIVRFNLDAALRGDFKTRQEGLKIMRDTGVINANEWREMENMNPIADDDGGEDYIRPMNMAVPGEEPPAPKAPPAKPPGSGEESTDDSET